MPIEFAVCLSELICPSVPDGIFGVCAEFCSDDGDCADGEKCCSNGCGHSCTAAIGET